MEAVAVLTEYLKQVVTNLTRSVYELKEFLLLCFQLEIQKHFVYRPNFHSQTPWCLFLTEYIPRSNVFCCLACQEVFRSSY